MKIQNEFVVAAPVEETWAALLDVPRVARALPGATIEDDGVAGVYRGTMKVKVGPVTSEYRGVAELQEADEDERVAVFRVTGREARGQGTATATIRNRVEPANGRTHVTVETDLQVTGRAAQLGRGMMEDVAARLLADFAGRLESEILAPHKAADAERATVAAEALDLGGAVWTSLLGRPGTLVGATVTAFTLGYVVGRRR